MRNVLFSTLVVVPGFLFSGCAFDVDGEAVLETDAGDIGAVLPAA